MLRATGSHADGRQTALQTGRTGRGGVRLMPRTPPPNLPLRYAQGEGKPHIVFSQVTPPHTLRVATAGGTAAARLAGP